MGGTADSFLAPRQRKLFFLYKNSFAERRDSMDYFENQEKQFFDYLEEMKKNDDADYGMALAL